jgi:hypothetical protein
MWLTLLKRRNTSILCQRRWLSITSILCQRRWLSILSLFGMQEFQRKIVRKSLLMFSLVNIKLWFFPKWQNHNQEPIYIIQRLDDGAYITF